jgi:hypothetical protein
MASHMEYEGSIGFVTRKMKKKIADFHVLGLFMAKKHDLSDKKFRLSRAVAVAEICLDTSSVPMKAIKLKFWLP